MKPPIEQTPRHSFPRNPRTALTTELQVKLRAEIQKRTVEEIAADMGVSHNTVSNMAAGRGCNESSKMLARIYFNGREPA